MKIFIIYLIGYLLCYFLLKKRDNKLNFPNDYTMVLLRSIISLFSWFSILILLITLGIEKLFNYKEDGNNKTTSE